MANLSHILIFLQKNLKTLIVLIIFNCITSIIIVLSWQFDSDFIASVKVVFNEVKLDFQDNQADNYLFSSERSFEFINLLESDSLLLEVARQYNYADIREIPESDKDRIKIASQAIRRRTKIQIEKHSIKISFVEKSGELAEKILLAMVEEVQRVNIARMQRNNAITQQIAREYLKDIDSTLQPFQEELKHVLFQQEDVGTVNQRDLELRQIYRKYLSQKMSIESVIKEIERSEHMPKYDPYFVINQGVRNQNLKPYTIIILALFANIVVFAFEFQILFFYQYLRRAIRKIEEK